MKLKDYITESFNKEYGYRVKFAADCGSDQMDMLEKCLDKYNLVSATPFKRTPIEENPKEFYRAKEDVDRQVSEEDALLNDESMEHYENENADVDFKANFFGEEYNKKFLEELAKIKAEKGADYFRNYPSKDELMGDDLAELGAQIHGLPNMGRGTESSKTVDVISQSSKRS